LPDGTREIRNQKQRGWAWSDEDSGYICCHLRSHLFFAHVRAATGTAVTRQNSHPFACDQVVVVPEPFGRRSRGGTFVPAFADNLDKTPLVTGIAAKRRGPGRLMRRVV
jgi:hypothetical protein